MVMCGELSPCKDLAISAKLGAGVHLGVTGLFNGVFAHWLEMVEVPGVWLETGKVFAVVGMVSFECPIMWVAEKEPQGWALLHLLCLHSCMVSGSTSLEGWEEVTFTQCNNGSLARTSSLVNDISSSTDSLNSLTHAATWHGWPAQGGWAFSTQNCKAFA